MKKAQRIISFLIQFKKKEGKKKKNKKNLAVHLFIAYQHTASVTLGQIVFHRVLYLLYHHQTLLLRSFLQTW